MAFSTFNTFQSNLWKSFGGGLAYLLNYRFSTTDYTGISIYNYADVSAGTALTPKYDASMSVAGLVNNTRYVATTGGLNLYNGGNVFIGNLANTSTGGFTISTWFRSNNSNTGYWPLLYFSNGAATDVISVGVSSGTLTTSVYQVGTTTYTTDFSAYTTPFSTLSPPSSIEGLAITSDKTRMLIATYGGTIYTSTYTSGAWGTLTNTGITGLNYVAGAALTADGSRGIIANSGGLVYFFTWNGTTYDSLTQTADATSRNYYDIDITTDGGRIVAAVNGGYLYFANWNGTNYDAFTQTADTTTRLYNGIGVSSDGALIAGATADGYLYLAAWNGTNYDTGTAVNTSSFGTGSGVKFNSDASKIFVSLQNNATKSIIYFTSTSPGVYADTPTTVSTTYIPANLGTWAFCVDSSGSIYIDDYYSHIYYSQYATTSNTPTYSSTISLGTLVPTYGSYSQPLTSLETSINGFAISTSGTKAIYSTYGGNIYYTSYSGTWAAPTLIYSSGADKDSTLAMNGAGTRATIAYYTYGGIYYFDINGTNTVSLVQTGETRVDRNCSSSAMTPDGNTVVYCEEANGHVFYQKWNSGAGNYDALVIIPTPTTTTLHAYTAVGISTDGLTMAFYDNTDKTFNLCAWSTAATNYAITTTISFATTFRHIEFSYDNNFIYATKYGAGDSGAGVYYLPYTGAAFDTSFASVPSTAIPNTLQPGALATDGSGNLFYADYNGTSIYRSALTTTSILGNVNDNLWRHFSWQISTDGTYSYYINGALFYTTGTGLTYPRDIIRTRNYIGGTLDASVNAYFVGGVDELRVFKQILPSTTLSSNFEEGNVTLTAPSGLSFGALHTSGTINFTHSPGYVQRYNYRIVPTSGTTVTGTLTDTSANLSGLTPGTTYTVYLSATNPKSTTAETSVAGVVALQNIFYYKFTETDASGAGGNSLYNYASVVNGVAGSPTFDASLSETGLINSRDYLALSTATPSAPQYVSLPEFKSTASNISIGCWARTTSSGTMTMYDLGSGANNHNVRLGLVAGLPQSTTGGNVSGVSVTASYTIPWTGLAGNIGGLAIDKSEMNAVLVDRTKTYLLDASYNSGTSTWSAFTANSAGDVSNNITCVALTEEGDRGVLGTVAGNVYTFTRAAGNTYTGFTKLPGIIAGNIVYYAAGAGTNSFSYSTNNGAAWTAGTGMTTAIFSVATRGIAAAGNTLVAVGDGATYTLAYSVNSGAAWTGLNKTIFSTYGNAVCWSETFRLFVAGGSGTNGLAYSSNGVTWTGLGTSVLSQGIDVKWNGAMFVATGKNAAGTAGGMAYSMNGTTWSAGTGTNFTTIGLSVAWNGSYWTAVGTDSGGSTMLYSSNGTSWSAVTGTNINGNSFTSVGAKVGGNVVAGYSGLVLTNTLSSFTQQTNAGSRAWTCIASNSDGTKLVAGVYPGYVYTSTDSGITWTQRDSSRNWKAITSSSDGTKLAAAIYNGYIFTSTNSGVNWTQQTNSGSRLWNYIASSSDGTKLAAVVSNGYIYTSTDSGATWTERTGSGSRSWRLIASSSDGTKLAACLSGYIWTSIDSGVTWTERTGSGSRSWISIASSSDGTKLAAGTNGGYIYTSIDSGVTWIEQTGSGTKGWKSITSSSDGTRLTACDNLPGYIYTSIDSGVNWTQQTSSGSQTWLCVTSSNDGAKIAAGVSIGYIYTATYYAQVPRLATAATPTSTTWTINDVSLNTAASSIIHDPSTNTFIASDTTGNIVTSTTNAASWSTRSQINSLTSIYSLSVKPYDPVSAIALDATGNTLAVSILGNYIYTSRWNGTTYPSLTKIADSNISPTSLALSKNGNILAYGASTNIYHSMWNGSTYPASTAVAVLTGTGNTGPISLTSDASGSGVLIYGVSNANTTATGYTSVFGTTTYGAPAAISTSAIPASRPTTALCVNYGDTAIYHASTTNIIKIPFTPTNTVVQKTYYNTALNDGKWHHYLWTMATTGTGVHTYYIDGVQANTYSTGVSYPTAIVRGYNRLGITSKALATANAWSGDIDEFNYYNMLVSAGQAGAVYASYTPTGAPEAASGFTLASRWNTDLSLNYTFIDPNGVYTRYSIISIVIRDTSSTIVYNASSYTGILSGLSPSTDYTGNITLTNSIGATSYTFSFTSLPPPATPVTGLASSNTMVTKSTLGYNASSNNVTGYYISLSPAVAGYPATTTNTTYNITGLAQTTTYTVSMYAIGLYGNSTTTTTSFTTGAFPTGGTVTTSGNYRVHTFTSSASFVSTFASLAIQYVLVGGGGIGGSSGGSGGGGGGGGVLSGSSTLSSGTYSVSVGNKGYNDPSNHTVFNGITAYSGGDGRYVSFNFTGSQNGASGGGGGYDINNTAYSPGTGISGQGYSGGISTGWGGGGGGAGGAGGTGVSPAGGGNGGAGKTVSINGFSGTFGGGGGGYQRNTTGYGGSGGGGNGATSYTGNGSGGSSNTGGGGGGAGNGSAGAGGSGLAVITYDYTSM